MEWGGRSSTGASYSSGAFDARRFPRQDTTGGFKPFIYYLHLTYVDKKAWRNRERGDKIVTYHNGNTRGLCTASDERISCPALSFFVVKAVISVLLRWEYVEWSLGMDEVPAQFPDFLCKCIGYAPAAMSAQNGRMWVVCIMFADCDRGTVGRGRVVDILTPCPRPWPLPCTAHDRLERPLLPSPLTSPFEEPPCIHMPQRNRPKNTAFAMGNRSPGQAPHPREAMPG